jgi:hypothetical protein
MYAQATTRYIHSRGRKRLLLVPIFDLMNHIDGCPHEISSLDTGEAVNIELGQDTKAGEEVCGCTWV